MRLYYTSGMIFFLLLLSYIDTGMCTQMPNQNICVADINLIFQQSNAEKNAKSKLEIKQQEMGAALDKISKEIDKTKENLQRESMVVNEKVMEEKERDLRIKINDLKSLKTKFQKDLDILQQTLVSDIEMEILSIVSEVGKSKGYSLVINKSAVLYSEGVIDMTDTILSKYNEKFAKEKR